VLPAWRPNIYPMTGDDDLGFEPRLGRVRRGRGDGRARGPRSFLQEVQHAVARAGGDPRRIGRARSAPRTGRFNARGRGAKLAASFPREHGWGEADRGTISSCFRRNSTRTYDLSRVARYSKRLPGAEGRRIVINLVGKFPLSQNAGSFFGKARAAIEAAGFGLQFSLMRPN
jgi:hypothetical protein